MTTVDVRSEPLTYHREARHSYYQDLIRERTDAHAAARLRRHAAEMDAYLDARSDTADRELRAAGFEYRVTPNRTQGTGGYFAPPLWLIDEFAIAPRPARVLAALAPGFPLPGGVQSVNVPRLTTGGAEQAQADTGPDNGADIVDASTTGQVVTVSGHVDVPLQMLDQSPAGAHLDWVMFRDLTAAYDAQLEGQLQNGGGSASAQIQGVIGLAPAANQVSYTAASPTFTAMYPYLGQAAARVGDNRNLPPEAWIVRTARWAWMATSEDSQSRPIVTPDVAPPGRVPGGSEPISSMMGWPLYLSDALPANLGTAVNQDIALCLRPSDLLVFEADPRTAVMDQVLSGTLQVRLQLRNYAAAITGRWPSGIATVGGSGFVVQTGF